MHDSMSNNWNRFLNFHEIHIIFYTIIGIGTKYTIILITSYFRQLVYIKYIIFSNIQIIIILLNMMH